MRLDSERVRADEADVVEAARVPWQPLGRIMVSKGLLSEEQLEHALAHQTETGRRLGETLVELGYVSRSALTRALAAQYGLELTAETGFGTGLRAEIEKRTDGDEGEDVPDAGETLHIEVPELAQLEEQWAKLAAAEHLLGEAERELTMLRERDEHHREQIRRLIDRVRELDDRMSRSEAPPLPDGHVVLVQLDGRYELVERDGAPPEPNAIVLLPELCEGTWRVGSVGRSPLPKDARPCAFVQPV